MTVLAGHVGLPLGGLEEQLTSALAGAPLPLLLVISLAIGLRHAMDPDHLVTVASLVATNRRGVRDAARLGACWGAGHGGVLLAAGLPLTALRASLPPSVERIAQYVVGVVIVVLALRVLRYWRRLRRPLALGESPAAAPPPRLRSPAQSLAIGMLHGLAGTGAVVVVLAAALPAGHTVAALAVFALASTLAMVLCTAGYAWVCTRHVVAGLYRSALLPALGVLGLVFGAWYCRLL